MKITTQVMKRAKEITYPAIVTFLLEHGQMPTRRELSGLIGSTSANMSARDVVVLKDEGWLNVDERGRITIPGVTIELNDVVRDRLDQAGVKVG